METQYKTSSAKDFIINLGAIVALYTLVVSLFNLLFTIINTMYPQISNGYNYAGSGSISWPVATLVIFFPIFIFLMWLMEREYTREPERKNMGIHKWLTYITLFIAGLLMAGDLITVLYYFLDGQELTVGFLLKVFVVLVVAAAIFTYYISDVMDKLTGQKRKFWRVMAGVIILGSIIWGFSVLGSPATQRLYKYDQEKVNALTNLNYEISNYYTTTGALPSSLESINDVNYSPSILPDSQTGKPYEYEKTGDTTYNLCAEFNKASNDNVNTPSRISSFGDISWTHPAGHYCFAQTINTNMYPKPVPF